MHTHAEKIQKNRSQSTANKASQMHSSGESDFQFTDNRPETIVQGQLQEMANNSSQVMQLRALQETANSNTNAVIQRKETYAYGSADTIPHIHVYSGGDCHLKIVDRGRVRRYNIVQNGKRHSQADDALAAAAGNATLLQAINGLL